MSSSAAKMFQLNKSKKKKTQNATAGPLIDVSIPLMRLFRELFDQGSICLYRESAKTTFNVFC